MDKKLDQAAKKIITALKSDGAILQRYDAITSNSIYLKIDFGLCHSVRISDHRGKRHLTYRYNLIKGYPKVQTGFTSKGWERHYFPVGRVTEMIDRILQDRAFKLGCYGKEAYVVAMNVNENLYGTAPGFWSKAKLV